MQQNKINNTNERKPMKTISKIKHKCGGIITSFILTAAIIATGLIFSSNTFADDAPKTALTLSPMSQKIVLVPGETYEGTVKVVNGATSTKQMTYEASVGSFNPVRGDGKDDYNSLDLVTESNRNIMKDWTTIDKPKGVLEPNSTGVINFKVQVPKDAPAGAQYISILVTDVTSDEEANNAAKGNGASIQSKIQMGSIVYANVAGETVEKGSIKENNMPTFLTTNKLEATSMVRNEGNIYTDASYTLQVWPMFSDEEICTNEEKSESSLILPETERYHVQTCELPAVGIFKAKQVVKIFGEESVLEKTILVCPIWLMLVILLIVLGILIAIIVIVKKNKARKSAEE